MTLGLTVLKDFERRHGKGLAHLGASAYHGNYFRWYDARRGIFVDAGGSNMAKGGEILDTLVIVWRPTEDTTKDVPLIRLKKSEMGVLTKLHAGMSRREVEAALGARLAADVLTQKGMVRYSVRPINMNRDRYTVWKADFDFGAKGLQALTLTSR